MVVKKYLAKRSLAAILGKHFEAQSAQDAGASGVLVELSGVFERYDALVAQIEASSVLSSCVEQVREWQRKRLLQTYQTLLEHPSMGEASRFVLTQAYSGPNQVALLQSVKRIVNRAAKIFPLPLLRTATDVLALNTLTLELDLQTAKALLLRGYCPVSSSVLSESLYQQAFCAHESGFIAKRHEQLVLLESVGRSVEQYLGSQWVYAAFQVAQLPARKMGFGDVVNFMKPGFEAIHNLPVSAEQLLKIIIETEHYCLQQLLAGEEQVFGRVRVAQLHDADHHQAIMEQLPASKAS